MFLSFIPFFITVRNGIGKCKRREKIHGNSHSWCFGWMFGGVCTREVYIHSPLFKPIIVCYRL